MLCLQLRPQNNTYDHTRGRPLTTPISWIFRCASVPIVAEAQCDSNDYVMLLGDFTVKDILHFNIKHSEMKELEDRLAAIEERLQK